MTRSSPPVRPFADAVEIPLDASPIVRVVAQARYRGNASRMDDAAGEKFKAIVADWLPFADRAQAVELLIGPNGIQQQEAAQAAQWIFHDGGDRRVTLTAGWASYDVGPYDSRTAFCADLRRIFGSLQDLVGAVPVGRLGIRYINQISDAETLTNLPRLVRRELLGVLQAPEQAEALVHSFTESLFRLGDAGLQARHGLMPAGVLVDPTVKIVPRASWVLDLDAFTEQAPPLSTDLADRATQLAAVAYNYFRWAMTEEALKLFKGEQ